MRKHSHIVVFTLAALMTSTGVAHAAPQSTGDAEAAKAISLYTSALGDITTMSNGVHITNSGHGSSFHAAPSAELVDHQSVFYGLTDRGPNVDGDLAGADGLLGVAAGFGEVGQFEKLSEFDRVAGNGHVDMHSG